MNSLLLLIGAVLTTIRNPTSGFDSRAEIVDNCHELRKLAEESGIEYDASNSTANSVFKHELGSSSEERLTLINLGYLLGGNYETNQSSFMNPAYQPPWNPFVFDGANQSPTTSKQSSSLTTSKQSSSNQGITASLFCCLNASIRTFFQPIADYQEFKTTLETSIISRFCKPENSLSEVFHQFRGQIFVNPVWRMQKLKFNCLDFVMFSHLRRLNNTWKFDDRQQATDLKIEEPVFQIQESIMNFLRENRSYIDEVRQSAEKIQNSHDKDMLMFFITFMEYSHSEELVVDLIRTWFDMLFSLPEIYSERYGRLYRRLIKNMNYLFNLIEGVHVDYIFQAMYGSKDLSASTTREGIMAIHKCINEIEKLIYKKPIELEVWYFNACKYTYMLASILRSIYLFSEVRNNTFVESGANENPITQFSVDMAAIFSTFDRDLFAGFFGKLGNPSHNYLQAIMSHF